MASEPIANNGLYQGMAGIPSDTTAAQLKAGTYDIINVRVNPLTGAISTDNEAVKVAAFEMKNYTAGAPITAGQVVTSAPTGVAFVAAGGFNAFTLFNESAYDLRVSVLPGTVASATAGTLIKPNSGMAWDGMLATGLSICNTGAGTAMVSIQYAV